VNILQALAGSETPAGVSPVTLPRQKEIPYMSSISCLSKLQSLFVAVALFVNRLAPYARAQQTPQLGRNEAVFINFGQPNIWSLEQAHYLLFHPASP
jgi:hypothetical protein